MAIIPPGTYRINPVLFAVHLADVLDIPDNKVGIVTTREGAPLPTGEIAGPVKSTATTCSRTREAFIDARRHQGPAGAGAAGRPILHQPALRDRRSRRHDRSADRLRRRRHRLRRRGRQGRDRREFQARQPGEQRAKKASGSIRSIRANTRSIPIRTRSRTCRPRTWC